MITTHDNRLPVLFVTQRYGAEVIGGAEDHARKVAERLAAMRYEPAGHPRRLALGSGDEVASAAYEEGAPAGPEGRRMSEAKYRVEVATTTALDYWTWANHYRAGRDEVNGIPVWRFRVARGRARDFKDVERRVAFGPHTLAEEEAFVEKQGPFVPDLLEFLHREGRRYEAIVFYGYLYYPTARGLPLLPERAALVPTAHDERALRAAPYRALFHLPRAIGYLTAEERDLVWRTFRNEHVPFEVVGLGLDSPPAHHAGAFRGKRGLAGPLVLYLGQVVEAKGCDELFALWAAFRDRDGAPPATLVLAGPIRMAIPDRTDVVALGPISEEEKYAALSAASALVNPSRFESLGLTLLEAWQVWTPALAPSGNAVTAGQVGRSGGGLTYGSTEEFIRALERLLDDGRGLGAAGRAWVARECSWDAVLARFDRLIAEAAVRP